MMMMIIIIIFPVRRICKKRYFCIFSTNNVCIPKQNKLIAAGLTQPHHMRHERSTSNKQHLHSNNNNRKNKHYIFIMRLIMMIVISLFLYIADHPYDLKISLGLLILIKQTRLLPSKNKQKVYICTLSRRLL